MNVYLTTLDEGYSEEIQIILDMFEKDMGPITFSYLDPTPDAEYFKKYDQLERISLPDLFEINEAIKREKRIDYHVVLLTKKSLDIPYLTKERFKDWHSAFLFHNLMVNTTRWKKITGDRSYLAVAHQIIENVFQSLSHIQINSQKIYRDVHLDMDVCINDYCANLNETKSKIASGLICRKCQERFHEFNPDGKNTLQQIRNILKRISDRFRDNYDLSPTEDEKKIVIDGAGDIYMGGTRIDFGKSTTIWYMYLFYLINYNKKISSYDFKIEKGEVRSKFSQLIGDIGKKPKDDKKPNIEFNYNAFIKGIRTHTTRAKDYLQNSLQYEALAKLFEFQTQADSEGVNHYFISVEEKDISINDFFKQYRVIDL